MAGAAAWKRRAAAGAAALLLLAALTPLLGGLRRFAVDDSFIFFRYADNLAAGRGFVFNPGEAPGEGFTSWAWLLLLALGRRLGATPLATARLLGLLAYLLTAPLLYRLARRACGDEAPARWAAWTAAAAALLNYRLAAHSLGGMETALYTLAIAALALLTLRALQAPAAGSAWLVVALAALAAFFVRPEGLAAGGLALLALAAAHRGELRRARPWRLAAAGLLLPLALFLAWKTAHFGYPLPHSFYHKRIVRAAEYGESLRQLGLFVRSYGWLLLAAAAAAAAALRRRDWPRAFPFVFFVPLAGVYLFFYPAMNYLHRFYMPYLPLLLAGAAPGLAWLYGRIASRRGGWRLPAAAAGAALLVVIAVNWDVAGARAAVSSWTQMVDPAVNRGRLGRLMAELPRNVVVANTEMGVIPYFSGLTCIDMAGLTDPHVAHHGLAMEYLDRRGVAMILFPEDVARISAAGWRSYTLGYGAVFCSPRFRRDFVPVGSFAAWSGGNRKYHIYADRTSPHFAAIETWRRRHAAELGGG